MAFGALLGIIDVVRGTYNIDGTATNAEEQLLNIIQDARFSLQSKTTAWKAILMPAPAV
jgi:hypothetical protein